MTAGSDPPSPDDPGASRQRSGPADVPASLLVAARNGDAGAFASFIEHWDGRLRPFVHHTLAGDGSTDRVLAAAYVRAYRALPRYRSARAPGLWLHRVAYLAAIDELRRLTRDPMRRRARVHPEPAPAEPDAETPPPTDPVQDALRRLAPDQRAIAALVDLEGFAVADVAKAFDTATGVVTNRLGSARWVIAEAAEPRGADEIRPGSASRGDTPRRPLARRREEGGGPDAPAVTTGAADPLGGVLMQGSSDLAPPAPGSGASPGTAGATLARPRADRSGLAGPDAPFPVPSWAETETETETEADDSAVSDPAAPPTTTPGTSEPESGEPASAAPDRDGEELGPLVATALGALPVPPPADGFWTELGRRLLAERERPAAPTPDPVARLARAHPAEAGFQPRSAQASVTDLADQADKVRPRRRWGRPLAIVAAVILVAGIVAAAVAVGISGRTPDGSVSGGELAVDLAAALDSSRALLVDATVEGPGSPDGATAETHELVVSGDGSWSDARTDAIDKATFDASTGTFRRILVVPAGPGADPGILATEETGLGGGPPDPTPPAPPLLDDLRAIGTLLRSDPERRAAATTVDGMASWTYRRTVPSGDDGVDQEWRVVIRRSDALPIRIERFQDGERVRLIRFSGWTPDSSVDPETFRQAVPPSATLTSAAHGFGQVDLNEVPILGRGDAVTPGWLPEGFELATVSVLGEAPAGARSTGAGTNPPDVAVMSLAYQRGPERITVTTRASTAPAGDWTDPFATPSDPGDPTPDRRTLGDGRFNQTSVSIGTDAVGRASLWGVDDDTVVTVGGDLTADEAFRVANSLR